MVTADESTERTARVRAMTLETDDVLAVELEPVDGPIPEWAPGAHIDLLLPDAPVRQYSLTGEPGASRYRIAVLREEHSRGGSKAVHERLRPGDLVTLRGPRNHFALEPAPEYLFIAGGIGITPIVPMLHAAHRAGARWRLLYLGATRSRMAFLDEVMSIGSGTVTVVPRDEGSRADLAATLTALPEAAVYACGPERMLTALRELLPEDSGRLRLEYFAAPEVEYEPGGAFSIRLARSGLELPVEPGQSVLEVMRSGGVEVLTDCEEGICGSCETHVLEGEVEHRDFVLTSQERARMDCMMVCVSRAACPMLVLDA
ncbi:PDR/VanB family oxidoreductase [Microbacterium allomyrinae]|uniref:Oxidoreductase n=1 Tax=Microbacterium allomyrinae TaxID=2830666 RepID=A0A9X1LUV3_9MICO|nr:PDR/VanB family oxidoreductase [Microbacterium allomyrinae]MCC2032494.1 oxidoreductase [Microbacterium allomyrinae]